MSSLSYIFHSEHSLDEKGKPDILRTLASTPEHIRVIALNRAPLDDRTSSCLKYFFETPYPPSNAQTIPYNPEHNLAFGAMPENTTHLCVLGREKKHATNLVNFSFQSIKIDGSPRQQCKKLWDKFFETFFRSHRNKTPEDFEKFLPQIDKRAALFYAALCREAVVFDKKFNTHRVREPELFSRFAIAFKDALSTVNDGNMTSQEKLKVLLGIEHKLPSPERSDERHLPEVVSHYVNFGGGDIRGYGVILESRQVTMQDFEL